MKNPEYPNNVGASIQHSLGPISLVTDKEFGQLDGCTFTYICDDPYAVHAAFSTRANPGKEATKWVFSRDLLVSALRDGRAGEGDIKVTWEDEGNYYQNTAVMLELVSPAGEATLYIDREKIVRFLD